MILWQTSIDLFSLNVSFRRGLVNTNRVAWLDLVSKVVQVHLTDDKDVFQWNLTENGLFTVRSMYSTYIQEGVPSYKSPLWKLKIPLKIKIFLWYLKKRGVTLTKDNLAKRNWQGSIKCSLCSSVETIQHLSLTATLHVLFRILCISHMEFNLLLVSPIC